MWQGITPHQADSHAFLKRGFFSNPPSKVAGGAETVSPVLPHLTAFPRDPLSELERLVQSFC